jgi:hypothetical protein
VTSSPFVSRLTRRSLACGATNVAAAWDVLARVAQARHDLQLAGLDAGDVEDLVHQPRQASSAQLDALEERELLGRRLAGEAKLDELGVADNRVDGRADLVTHGGEERGLRAIRIVRPKLAVVRFADRELDLCCHGVERVGELCDLVITTHVDSPIVRPGRNCAGCRAQLGDGTQHAPGDEHGHRDAEQREQCANGDDAPEEAAGMRVRDVGWLLDDEVPGRRHERLRECAVLAVAASVAQLFGA